MTGSKGMDLCGFPIALDRTLFLATHSAQLPAGEESASGAQYEWIETLRDLMRR